MEKKINANYELIDSVSIAGNTYVLGENLKAPSPYVTWSEDPKGGYSFGHYFTDLNAARVDLLKRGMSHLPEASYDQLFRDNLPDHIRSEITREDREAGFFQDIENCLYDAVEHLGGDSSAVEDLMKNKEFRGLALHTYYRQDHSYENEALSESLETLVRDKFMHVLAAEHNAILKISPEEMDMINDVLSLTADEVAEKYGPFESGENLLRFSKSFDVPRLGAEMLVTIFPKETAEDQNSVNVNLLLYKHNQIETDISMELHGVETLEQVYSIQDDNNVTWKLDLHADERLRRIGQAHIYQPDTDDPVYLKHNNETCTVTRSLTKEEHDCLYSGLMWKAKFPDGTELDVFDQELYPTFAHQVSLDWDPTQQKPSKEIPLAEKLKQAEAEAAKNNDGSFAKPNPAPQI